MIQAIRERWKGPEIHKKSSEQFFYQFKKSWDFWCRNKDTLRNKVYGEIAGLQKWQTREVMQKKQNTSIKQYSRYQHTFTTSLNSECFTAVVYTLNKELTFSGDSIHKNWNQS